MREILFRGKRIDNGEWVDGFLFNEYSTFLLRFLWTIQHANKFGMPIGHYEIDPETVGQFTGLTDKNGKRIFEGDIIKADNGDGPPAVASVKFGENYPTMFYTMMDFLYPGYKCLPAISFYAETIDKHQHLILFQSPCVEVIGNIHDNPELIGERKDNE